MEYGASVINAVHVERVVGHVRFVCGGLGGGGGGGEGGFLTYVTSLCAGI